MIKTVIDQLYTEWLLNIECTMFPMVAHTGSVTHETLNWAATGLSQTEIKMAWNHAVLTPRILRLPQDSGSNDSDKLWKVNDWISWPGHMLSQLIPVSSFKRRQQQQQQKTKSPWTNRKVEQLTWGYSRLHRSWWVIINGSHDRLWCRSKQPRSAEWQAVWVMRLANQLS